jgi:hypothetical protein
MEIFLIIAALVFLIFGSLLLLSIESVVKISNLTNRVLLNIDDKIHIWRRPLGVMFLAVSIFSWYVALAK